MPLTSGLKAIFYILMALIFSFSISSCDGKKDISKDQLKSKENVVELVVLGIAQDAGYPQIACDKQCCAYYYSHEIEEQFPTSLALIDRSTNKFWIFEASPSFREQLKITQELSGFKNALPDALFLSHAHIGHYTGLMQLGHEVLGAKGVKVYAMPRMSKFLSTNGPWDQLVNYGNIEIELMEEGKLVQLSEKCKVEAIRVPHRDEYSETVGFKIFGPSKTVLFIPDIDKWNKWRHDIVEQIKLVDYAFLDGTFYNQGELPGRDMSLVPHPFIQESMELFSNLPDSEKAKIHFIHFNHSNPMIWDEKSRNQVLKKGFKLAETKQQLALD